MPPCELTVFAKQRGAITKRISLDGEKVHKDSSRCGIGSGFARRVTAATPAALASLISKLEPHLALGLGVLRDGLADTVTVLPKDEVVNNPDAIARTKDNFNYRPGVAAWCLLDYEGMRDLPETVALEIEKRSGLWPTLLSNFPGLTFAAHVTRGSTSSGLYNSQTGEVYPDSGGQHIYIVVQDGTDIERFLKDMNERLWLAGFGFYKLSKDGKLLDRSLIDITVGSPERLIFESGPELVHPVAQDANARKPKPFDGININTRIACPPLNEAEKSRVAELKSAAREAIKPAAEKKQKAFVEEEAPRIAARTNLSLEEAREIIEQQCGGVLPGEIELFFDDPSLGTTTVAQIVADPQKYDGQTLADPIEGIDYGRCKAILYKNDDGSIIINSYAHGGRIYHLKATAQQMFEQAIAAGIQLPASTPISNGRLIKTSAEFVKDFIPPDYLVKGLLIRGYCYSFTAPTGHAKTAIALNLTASVALGRPFAGREVRKGRVLYVVAENETDVQLRWIALAHHWEFDPTTIDVHFLSATKLSEIAQQVTDEVAKLGGIDLVVVDTSAATFEGDNENDSVPMIEHAKRMRSMTTGLAGRPTVLVLCHPTKRATKDDLLPRGGGSFIAEMDGNLCAWKEGNSVELHWCGKFRGLDFAPILFEVRTVTAPSLKDSDGDNLPTVMVEAIDEARREALATDSERDDILTLQALGKLGEANLTILALNLCWVIKAGKNEGKPNHVRVRRALEKLKKEKYVEKHFGNWRLTKLGKKEFEGPEMPPRPERDLVQPEHAREQFGIGCSDVRKMN